MLEAMVKDLCDPEHAQRAALEVVHYADHVPRAPLRFWFGHSYRAYERGLQAGLRFFPVILTVLGTVSLARFSVMISQARVAH